MDTDDVVSNARTAAPPAAPKYQKIQNVFRRSPETHGIDPYAWGNEAIGFLVQAQWLVQEKIDGTNVRIIWDGNRVSFGSKNTLDTSNLPGRLREHLEATYGTGEFEQIIEQEFGGTPITIYGEGYGHKIQKGADYFPDSPEGENRFIGFDVRVDGHYLPAARTAGVLQTLGVPMVKQADRTFTIPEVIADMTNAINSAAEGEPALTHAGTSKEIEGYVLRPAVPLFDRRGNRVLAKIILNDVRQIAALVAEDLERQKADESDAAE